MKRARLAMVAAGMLVACSTRSTPDPQLLARTEIDVYTAAYKAYTEFDPDSASADTLFISAQFAGYEEVEQTVEELRKNVGEELARAYAQANRTAGRHAGPPATNRRRVVFGVDSLMPHGAPMHARILEFSRPGINATGDSAVVRIGFGCGFLCGRWETQLLAKGPSGRWHVVKSFDHAIA